MGSNSDWHNKDYDVRKAQEEEDRCSHEWVRGDGQMSDSYRCRRCGSTNYDRYNAPAGCSHDWVEVGRDALGSDGGGYHDGRGEMWYSVERKCRRCGASDESRET